MMLSRFAVLLLNTIQERVHCLGSHVQIRPECRQRLLDLLQSRLDRNVVRMFTRWNVLEVFEDVLVSRLRSVDWLAFLQRTEFFFERSYPRQQCIKVAMRLCDLSTRQVRWLAFASAARQKSQECWYSRILHWQLRRMPIRYSDRPSL